VSRNDRLEARRNTRIPQFANREEEANWWDAHDIADYWDEFKQVQLSFGRNLSEGITIRLQPETLAELRRRAAESGVGPTTLARMWIMDRLRTDRGKESTQPGR
jgi:hypothetical protein